MWRDYLKDNLVDEKLGQLLDKMVANSLVQRYQSAKTVLNILEKNSGITYNSNYLAQHELAESAINRFDTSHIKQVLESIVSSSNLEFTAHKLGERLTQILTIPNNVSEIIRGC